MKKSYRRSQLRIAGKLVTGFHMHQYGLPYDGALGSIFAKNKDHVALMLAALERHPELHVLTYFKDGRAVNRFEVENAYTYSLLIGNADPNIEFNANWSADDFTDEEWQQHFKRNEEFLNSERTPEEIAAVNWTLNKISRSG